MVAAARQDDAGGKRSLRELGFREGEVRAVMTELRQLEQLTARPRQRLMLPWKLGLFSTRSFSFQ